MTGATTWGSGERLLPLLRHSVSPATAVLLQAGFALPFAVTLGARLHGALEWIAVVVLSAALFPLSGHGLAWAHRTIVTAGWGRSRLWLVAVPIVGALLEPASGIEGGGGDLRWWAKVLVLGAVAVGTVLLLARVPVRGGVAATPRFLLACAGAYAASLVGWLVAFWPAVMSVDSVVQWRQLVTGDYDNVHPAFHTGFLWLVTRIVLSPAAVVVAQIVLLTFALWTCLRELSLWGVPRRVLGIVTILFIAMPANGILAVTVWKDLPYTACIMILGAQLFAIGRTDGAVLQRWPFLIGVGVNVAATCLLRHNGVVATALIAAVVPLVFRRGLRLRLLVPVGLGLGVFALVVGPGHRVAGVRPADPAYVSSIPIHHVGAIVRAEPESFGAEERAFLERLQPLSAWRENYLCYSVVPLLYGAELDKPAFAQVQREFLQRWVGWAIQHPRVLLEHQACVSSVVWDVRRRSAPMYLFQRDINANSSGLTQASLAPGLRSLLERYLDFSEARGQVWWMWGTGLFLYLAIACALAAGLRTRTTLPVLFVLPAVLNAAALALVSVAQDFRFMYPMYVVGLLSLALPFAVRNVPCAPSPSASGNTPSGRSSSPPTATNR